MAYPTLEEFFIAHGALTFNPRIVRPFHRLIFNTVTQWVVGRLPEGKRHLMILMPPRHGKTFIARDLVAWATGLFPDSSWIYASYAAQLAIAQTVQIKECMASNWYRKIFRSVGVTTDVGRQDYFRTAQGGLVYGVGAGGAITGFGAGQKRGEFSGGIILDDSLKPEDARKSPSVREGVNAWYTGTLKSRRNLDTTPMLLIMQRLHAEDLAGHILNIEPESWYVLQVPACDEETGTMLWPETFSLASAEKLKIVDPATYYAQYQQSPIAPGGNMVKRDWWQWYAKGEIEVRGGLIFLTADTAYKATDASDASVIQVWHGTRDKLVLLDGVSGRWEFPELLMNAKAFWEKWKPERARHFFIEDKATGTPLEQTLRMNGVPAVAWKPSDFGFPDDKVGRVQEAAWSIHGGAVWLPRNEKYSTMLVDEAAAFAADMSHSKDDHVDTMTMAVSIWRHGGGGRR